MARSLRARVRSRLVVASSAALLGGLLPLVVSTPPAHPVAPGVDGRLVVVSDAAHPNHRDLFTMEPDGTGRTNLTAEDRAYLVYAARISPDGAQIAYSRSGGARDQIWVMNSDGSGKTQLTVGDDQGGSHPTWSPDGERIAFSRAGDVWSMAADGSDQTQLTDGSWSKGAPEWSPDGDWIVYVQSDQAAGSRVYRMTAGGAAETPLTSYNDRVGRPSWSPDGERILFWHDAGNVQGLYTMSPSGNGLTLLEAGAFNDFRSYAWSPEGDHIVFTRLGEASEDVWVMDADGVAEPTRVTGPVAGADHQEVSWGPALLDPTALPAQTQGIAMTPLQLEFGGAGDPTFTLSAGALPDGIALSESGLLTGTPTMWGDYSFVVAADDGETEESAVYSVHVFDPEDPEAFVVSPSKSTKASHRVTSSLVQTVQWTGTDVTSDAASYDVRVRSARWDGGFGEWSEPSDWQAREDTSQRHDLETGHTYCYSARAHDDSGRTGAWSAQRCTIAPLDQVSLADAGGWKSKSKSTYLNGTAWHTKNKGAILKRSGASLVRVGIFTSTCPTCGKVDVFVGSKKIGRINLGRGSSLLDRKALLLPKFSARTGTVKIKVVTKGRLVRIDGLIIGRT